MGFLSAPIDFLFALKFPGITGAITPPPFVPTGGLFTKGQDAIRAGLSFFLIIILLLAILYASIGAIRYIFARGDKQKIQGAREKVTYSIVGLIIAFLAFVLMAIFSRFLNVPLISKTGIISTSTDCDAAGGKCDLSCTSSETGVFKSQCTGDFICCILLPTPTPAAPILSVNPASIDFGDVLVGTGPTRTFDVQNTGGGTLSGAITGFLGTPFSCVDVPCTYGLFAGEIKAMTIKFAPTSEGFFSTTLNFSGGAGASRTVMGFGTVLIIPTSTPTPTPTGIPVPTPTPTPGPTSTPTPLPTSTPVPTSTPTPTPTPTPILCTLSDSDGLGYFETCTDSGGVSNSKRTFKDYCAGGFVEHFYSCNAVTQLCEDNTDTDCSIFGQACVVEPNGAPVCKDIGATVSGFVWIDSNEDGWLAGEPGFEGARVKALFPDNSVAATFDTDSSGSFQLRGLGSGTYTIVLEVPTTPIPYRMSIKSNGGSNTVVVNVVPPGVNVTEIFGAFGIVPL